MRTDLSGVNQENIMAIEHAYMRAVCKPWGSTDLRPWSEIRHDGATIGELWAIRLLAETAQAWRLFRLNRLAFSISRS
jgi:mannose-6-phosphate isomerase